MAKLTAQFIINPTFPLIVECKDDESFSYSFSEGEYDIQINLLFMEGSPKSGRVDSDVYKRLVDKAEIIISKEVGEIPINENGVKELYKLDPYFNGIKGGYYKLAQKYYQRLIKFIKYGLKQPFQDEEHINKDQFSNPSWSDDKGNDFGTIRYTHHVQPVPGMDGKTLGAETLTIEHADLIQQELREDKDVELYQEILSDAQAAIFDKDIRRAVFEMAIVCELSTKRKYFSEGGISGLAFDYFEDKGKIKVTILDLIANVAEEALGESFKAHSPQDYENIVHLFRCRNKVAHRGEALFKDDSGTLIQPDIKLVMNWFDSVESLLKWLSSK